MKAYMGYSRDAGPSEGAFLIFANNAREARKIAYPSVSELNDGDYLDCAVQWMKNRPWLFAEMKRPEPHCVDNPKGCKECKQWGDEIGDDGLCHDCRLDAAHPEEEPK
jgi:hypothetical protein